MKILFITTGHCIEDSRVTRKEAVALVNAGHEVTVCGRWAGKEYYNKNLRLIDSETLREIDESIALRPITISRFKRCLLGINLFKLARSVKPDLIVAHEFESALCALWIKICLDIPFVFDVHEGYEGSIPLIFPKIIRPVISCWIKALMRWIVKSSSGITACTPGVYPYQYAKSCGKPTELIYNSPPISKFVYSENEYDEITICHEGYVSEDRGPMQMIEAFGILGKKYNFKVKYFGAFDPELFPLVKRRVEELGLENIVEFVGYLDFDKLGQAESMCQIGIIIGNDGYNYRLALPNKIFSYMACGMAVVGPKFGEMERMIESDRFGLSADPKDPADIALKLAYLIDHPEERRQMARNGRKAIEEKYSWERMEEVMKEFYGSLKI